MAKPLDSAAEESKLRDRAAEDYCDRLAARIKYHHDKILTTEEEKSAFDSSWHHAFHFPVASMTTMSEAEISRLIYSQPRAQARLATFVDYPPAKWLLEQELTAKGKWPPADPGRDVFDVADELKLTGICFSGGGIRSATFNLGVLQGLAAEDRLNSFDYLSTVSGGGYIHQFLAAWISCENIEKVKHQLCPLPGPPSTRNFWPEPLRWLRRYSNYLTPKTGMFTADTWVAFAIWARNTFLNQIVLISSLLLVLLLPHFYLSSRGRFAHYLLDHGFVTAAIILTGFAIASGVIFFTQILHPPADHCHPAEQTGLGQTGILCAVFLPVLISVLALCPYLYRSSFWAGNRLPETAPHTTYQLQHWERVQHVVNQVAWPREYRHRPGEYANLHQPSASPCAAASTGGTTLRRKPTRRRNPSCHLQEILRPSITSEHGRAPTPFNGGSQSHTSMRTRQRRGSLSRCLRVSPSWCFLDLAPFQWVSNG